MPEGWGAPDPVGDLMGNVVDPSATEVEPADPNAGVFDDGTGAPQPQPQQQQQFQTQPRMDVRPTTPPATPRQQRQDPRVPADRRDEQPLFY
jgi:penicillin-binding protein 1A